MKVQNFEYYNPTKVVFGNGIYSKLKETIKSFYNGEKILITYGGGSIKETGIYQEVMSALDGFEVYEFSGIEANPEYSTLMKAVKYIKEEKIGFVLAVGGGSVIDGTKFIVSAAKYNGEPWDVLQRKKGCSFDDAVPFGTVLTLPATGSEMNSGAVISKSDTKEKLTMGGPQGFPKFSFLDPKVVSTLPKRQLSNGVIDAFMHTLEQYLTEPTWNFLQEKIAEGILSTLIEVGPKVVDEPKNEIYAANLMWCSTMALNGTLRAGVKYDWSTHMIGHELTALFGIDHARTLAIIAPEMFKSVIEEKREKLNQLGQRVFGLSGNCAEETIQKLVGFFEELGVSTKLRSYIDDLGNAPDIIKDRFTERNWHKLGEHGKVTPMIAAEIVKASY